MEQVVALRATAKSGTPLSIYYLWHERTELIYGRCGKIYFRITIRPLAITDISFLSKSTFIC